MSNLSLIQLIILGLLFTLVFGDIPKIVDIVKKLIKDLKKPKLKKQEKRELNPCPLVLETTILPTELFSF